MSAHLQQLPVGLHAKVAEAAEGRCSAGWPPATCGRLSSTAAYGASSHGVPALQVPAPALLWVDCWRAAHPADRLCFLHPGVDGVHPGAAGLWFCLEDAHGAAVLSGSAVPSLTTFSSVLLRGFALRLRCLSRILAGGMSAAPHALCTTLQEPGSTACTPCAAVELLLGSRHLPAGAHEGHGTVAWPRSPGDACAWRCRLRRLPQPQSLCMLCQARALQSTVAMRGLEGFGKASTSPSLPFLVWLPPSSQPNCRLLVDRPLKDRTRSQLLVFAAWALLEVAALLGMIAKASVALWFGHAFSGAQTTDAHRRTLRLPPTRPQPQLSSHSNPFPPSCSCASWTIRRRAYTASPATQTSSPSPAPAPPSRSLRRVRRPGDSSTRQCAGSACGSPHLG